MSTEVPAEQRLLQAGVSIHRQALDGSLLRPSVVISFELHRILEVLGIESRLVLTVAQVFDSKRNALQAVVGDDGSGRAVCSAEVRSQHVVLWVPAFQRFVDSTLFARSDFRHVCRDRPELTWPLIFGSEDGIPESDFLAIGARDPYLVRYAVFPGKDVRFEVADQPQDELMAVEKRVLAASWRCLSALLLMRALDPARVRIDFDKFETIYGAVR